jgi:hypothetical protein
MIIDHILSEDEEVSNYYYEYMCLFLKKNRIVVISHILSNNIMV